MSRYMWIILSVAVLFALNSAVEKERADTGFNTAGSAWAGELQQAGESLKDLSDDERSRTAIATWRELERKFPLASDWMLQDGFDEPLWKRSPAGGRHRWINQETLIGKDIAGLLQDRSPDRWISMIGRVVAELNDKGQSFARELETLKSNKNSEQLAALYLRACESRRAQRLKPLLNENRDGIVFARHYNMGGSHYAYTEGLSDAQNERHFYPGSTLNILRMNGTRATVETLIDDPGGVIRDVDVSWDGSTILFSWKKSLNEDDYSLYTMNAATREIKVLNNDLGHADYEGAFLPNGDIIFNSTRCVQIVDCWWTEVSNLYTCDINGDYMRRLTFDQVHTNYPAVLDDGRVVYTRWDYNDRGQLYPQGLLQMNPDGTAQQEYYGSNSWFPTTIIHARGLPGSQRLLAILTGHHSLQAGKLGILDPSKGRQENEGAQLVAPFRDTPAEVIDGYGQEGELFMYPYPIDDQHFLVSFAPRGWESGNKRLETVFGLYFMDMDGRRELLDRDDEKKISTGRMVPLADRQVPHVRPGRVDYTKDKGVYFVQDVYEGPGLEGVPRGTIRNLRVIALEFRVAGVGNNSNNGQAGNALVSTPISKHGSWDIKKVLGNAKVHADGSAMFEVPARTPVYFQALDEKGHSVQSMRSWSMVQPGEIFSCVGCHSDNKHDAPRPNQPSLAMLAGVQPLDQVYGEPAGFSFPEKVQPIFDRNCTACHDGTKEDIPYDLTNTLHRDTVAKRYWTSSYLSLTNSSDGRGQTAPYEGPVRWIHPQSVPKILPPYYTGAAKSPLIAMLEKGHHDVKLSRNEMQTIALWIDLAVPFAGDYTESNAWTEDEMAKYNHYMQKRLDQESVEKENIQAYIDRLLKK
jgi:hypothetical protein